MNPRDDDSLRELLEDAVSGVEPRHGLDSIRSRTKVHTMSNRPWILGAGAAVVATAATIAAFAVLGGDAGTTSSEPPPASSPSAAGTTDASPTKSSSEEPGPTTATIPVYYVGETGQGPRLYREFHRSPAAGSDNAVAEAVRLAVSGDPLDGDYTSMWPEGADVQHVQMVDGDTIVVDLIGASLLHDRPSGMTEDEASMSVEQLIYTAQAGYQNRAPVRFLLDGKITDTVLDVPTAEPVAQGDESSTLAQVWIIEPAEGARVPSGFEVSGIGAFFEANATWELRQGDTVVDSGFTMAEECCRMAPYTFPLPDVPAGDYLLVVKDEDMSGGEGFPPFEDSKNITIE
ncbi:MAG: Gmad2 immunoglobulin-like domain-containing protein [Nocardioides sp.]